MAYLFHIFVLTVLIGLLPYHPDMWIVLGFVVGSYVVHKITEGGSESC
jgi:hypothetical protein